MGICIVYAPFTATDSLRTGHLSYIWYSVSDDLEIYSTWFTVVNNLVVVSRTSTGAQVRAGHTNSTASAMAAAGGHWTILTTVPYSGDTGAESADSIAGQRHLNVGAGGTGESESAGSGSRPGGFR